MFSHIVLADLISNISIIFTDFRALTILQIIMFIAYQLVDYAIGINDM